MADEFVDIYDENLTHQGVELKSVAHRTGLWHFSIHCWIVRSESPGYVLFQKRGSDKELFPDLLDISAAGHYQSGEEPADGVREILEELGIDIDYRDLVPLGIKIDLGRYGEIINHEFCRAYLLHLNQPVSEYVPDPGEVEGLVQIAIPDGLALFGGRTTSAKAAGIQWSPRDTRWRPFEGAVTSDSFIPRVDPYYYKVFIMAERLLAGHTDLAI